MKAIMWHSGTNGVQTIHAWVGVKADYYVYVTNLDGSESVYRFNGTQFNRSIAYFCHTTNGSGNYEGLSSSNWEGNSDWTEFYYKVKLSPARVPDYTPSSEYLFESVKVRNFAESGIDESELPYLITVDENGIYHIPVYSGAGDVPSSATEPTGKISSYSLPNFDINFKVYAVQVESDSETYNSDVRAKLHTVMSYSTTAPTSGS